MTVTYLSEEYFSYLSELYLSIGLSGLGAGLKEAREGGAAGRERGARGPNDAYLGSKRFKLVARPTVPGIKREI